MINSPRKYCSFEVLLSPPIKLFTPVDMNKKEMAAAFPYALIGSPSSIITTLIQ